LALRFSRPLRPKKLGNFLKKPQKRGVFGLFVARTEPAFLAVLRPEAALP
jgi:hypothetical protein